MKSKQKCRPITIVGFFEGNNLGDIAILRSMVKLFHGYVKNNDIAVITRFPPTKTVLEEYRSWGITCIPLSSVWRWLRRLLNSNIVIGGGGHATLRGLFWPNGVSLFLIALNKLLKGRPVVLGIGADYSPNPLSRWIIKMGYSLAIVCACRDPYSAKTLTNIGVPASQVIVTADFAFSLALGADSEESRTIGDPIRVVVVPGQDHKYMNPAGTSMLQILQYFVDARTVSFDVMVMAHDWRHDFDVNTIDKLLESIGSSKIRSFFPKTFSQIREVYQSVDLVVSNRLHPLILAAAYGALPLAVSSSSTKVKSLVSLLEIPSLNDPETGELTLDLLTTLTRISIMQLKSRMASHVTRLSHMAFQNREIALKAWTCYK